MIHNGKGDRPRNCFGQRFASNWVAIDWRRRPQSPAGQASFKPAAKKFKQAWDRLARVIEDIQCVPSRKARHV